MSRRRPVMWTTSGDSGLRAPSQIPQVRDLTVEQVPSVFQPIVAVADGQLLAYEALVRCTEPAFSSPLALFDQAVLQAACGRLGRLIRESAFSRCTNVPLFVNVHPQELAERWLVRPDDPLCIHEAPVFLEITESATIEHYDLCTGVLAEVCARSGAHLVIDDFGAGYSNMMRLLDLKPAVVKLDRALVSDIQNNHRKQRLVFHTVNMCRDLGAKVVAEGIETIDELSVVRDLGVDYAQGYLLARPAYPPPQHVWPL